MTFQSAKSLSFPVLEATVIRQRRFVVIGANGNVVEANDGEAAIGVALEATTNTESDAIPIAPLDGSIVEVEAGAAIDVTSAAVSVASDNDGRAITATLNDNILGVALDSATAAGQIIRVFGLKPGAVSA